MLDGFPEIEALKRGDGTAWRQAFQMLWPLAFHAARHPEARLSAEDAEEAAQDALAQLARQIDKVQTFEQLKSRVSLIARRRAISRARHNSAAKRGPASVALDALNDASQAPEFSEEANTPASALDRREGIDLLRQAMGKLDPESRALLEQKIGGGMSYQELSEKYALPIGTVCAKVSRALRKLRQRLEDSPEIMKELQGFLRYNE